MKKRIPTHLTRNSICSVALNFLFFSLFLLISKHETFAQCTMMIDQDFNHWGDRRYTVADAKSDFNNKIKPWTASTYRGIAAPGAASNLIGDVAQETRIVNGELRAEYTKNDAGGYAGGFLFDPYFDGVEEAYLEYKVKFDDNFFWATGGKLPGLGGSSSGVNSETTGRGTIPSGCKYNENGWSARLMWRRNRAQTTNPYLILYSYFADKEDGSKRYDGDCGDAKRIYSNLNDNTWYTIRQYVKLNTPGQNDGVVTMWVNGEQTYHNTKEKIRNAGKGNLKINALIMNTYRGGSRTDPVWHSPRDEYAFFDDFKVWTGCSNPPNGGGTNTPPTGSFVVPSFNSIEEGYNQLYVRVNTSDVDGDSVDVTLKINGTEIRTEKSGPFEWGHATTPNPDETLNLTPGDYLFEAVIVDERGGSTTISKTITVTEIIIPNEAPTVEITSPLNNEVFFVGDEIILKANAEDDNQVTKVNFKVNGGYHSQDLTPNGIEYTTIFTPTEAGTYTIGARAFDADGESTEVSISIDVNLITSLSDKNNAEFAVYPNPTNGVVYLSNEGNWELLNLQGTSLLKGSSSEIDLSGYSYGVYFLKIGNTVKRVILE